MEISKKKFSGTIAIIIGVAITICESGVLNILQ